MNTPLSAASIRDLVRPDQVHKDLYLSPELFALEQREFFGNTWQYAGHTSQIAQPLAPSAAEPQADSTEFSASGLSDDEMQALMAELDEANL